MSDVPNKVLGRPRIHPVRPPTELEEYWLSRAKLQPLQDFMRGWVVESICMTEYQRLIEVKEHGNERI